MESLRNAARLEFIVLLAAFGVVVLWKLLRDGSFGGLLRADDGSLSPGRIQMLVLTLMTAMQYLLAVLHDPTHLPTLPDSLIVTLGGSQVVYLGSKAWARTKKTKEK